MRKNQKSNTAAQARKQVRMRKEARSAEPKPRGSSGHRTAGGVGIEPWTGQEQPIKAPNKSAQIIADRELARVSKNR